MNSSFYSRSCTSEYLEGFSGSGGIMLFVNANDSFDGLSIVDTYPLESSSKFEGEPDLHTEWEPNMVPRQVNLVELLQFLMHPPFERCLRRLVIIISAWDVIDTSNLEPIKWLEKGTSTFVSICKY
ncbi:TRAFAC clade GTPase domain-containing protein [Budvicia aquatica]|nr:hypothetical protein [Budvicia aquatica]